MKNRFKTIQSVLEKRGMAVNLENVLSIYHDASSEAPMRRSDGAVSRRSDGGGVKPQLTAKARVSTPQTVTVTVDVSQLQASTSSVISQPTPQPVIQPNPEETAHQPSTSSN